MNMLISLMCNCVVNLGMLFSNSADNMINYCVSYSLYDFANKVLQLYMEPDENHIEWELSEDQIEKFEYFAPKYNKEGVQVLYLNNLGNPYSDLKLNGYEVVPISPFFYFDNGMPEKLTKEAFHRGVSYYNIEIGLDKNVLTVRIWLEFLKFHQSWKERFQYKLKGNGKVWMDEKLLYGYDYRFEYNCEKGDWEFIKSFRFKDYNGRKKKWRQRSKEFVPVLLIYDFEGGYYE